MLHLYSRKLMATTDLWSDDLTIVLDIAGVWSLKVDHLHTYSKETGSW